MANLFSGAPKVIPEFTGLQVNTSVQVLPIPIIYGTPRTSVNLLYYNGFQVKQVSQGGGKGILSGGSITAQVWKIMGPKGSCKKVGGLHIGPDGSIRRWTAIPAPWRHTTNADAELKSLGMPGYF